MTQKELQEYRKIMRNAESIEYQIHKLQSQINKVTAIVNDMPRGGNCDCEVVGSTGTGGTAI